ncbi:hypothetical protein KEM48_009412 [Puccinia striiformis f. sp. tritici PST-130]|nr:hypothetical protein KEM48_009412 [Puccinia striiformis f. sp. tritici PST-130]
MWNRSTGYRDRGSRSQETQICFETPPRLLVDPDGNTYPEIKVTVTEKHVTFSPNGPEVFSESQTTTEGQHLLEESTKKETTLATPRNKKLAEYASFFRGINPSMHPHPPGFPTSNLEPEVEKAQSLKEATVRHLSMLHLSRDHGQQNSDPKRIRSNTRDM